MHRRAVTGSNGVFGNDAVTWYVCRAGGFFPRDAAPPERPGTEATRDNEVRRLPGRLSRPPHSDFRPPSLSRRGRPLQGEESEAAFLFISLSDPFRPYYGTSRNTHEEKMLQSKWQLR